MTKLVWVWLYTRTGTRTRKPYPAGLLIKTRQGLRKWLTFIYKWQFKQIFVQCYWICICMCARVRVRKRTRTRTCTRTCTCTYTYKYAYTYMHMYMYMYMYICVCISMCTYTCACMCTCACTYICIRICMCIYIYMSMYILAIRHHWFKPSPPVQNGRHFGRHHLQTHFLMKNFEFILKFRWSLFRRVQLTIHSIGLDKGLAPNRWQAII